MPRRKKREQKEERPKRLELNPETKRGIVAVVLFAVAALLFLSFFAVAGSLGAWIDSVMSGFFGWDRFLVPLLLIVIGATALFPERGFLSAWNHLGFFFFFLSFNALLNLLNPDMLGGYLGQFLALAMPALIGFWGAIVVCSALLLVSVLLIFNTSLRRVIYLHEHVAIWFGRWRGKEQGELGEQEDGEVEEKEIVTVEESDEEETKKAFRESEVQATGLMPSEERALTVKRRRQVEIPLNLLDYRGSKANSGDIERNKEIIQRTLAQFDVEVEMGETATGPTVTQYTLRPSQGIKLSRIVALQNDLALALAAHPIRIEAPIPGKSLVGIEVPNQSVAVVSLRELLESKPFQRRVSPLTVPLGKDVSGHAWVAALEKMPHMLVAGATGSGKSVCLNTLIVSLLYENGPDDLKFILVDPKRVELNAYDGIPHLLVPPIMKLEDTVNALKWTVREMERRLEALSRTGARDIAAYNAKVEEKMPKIVIVIDELADLMAASGHEIEAMIVRIAQMARAVGIHLVVATQRPSVDVITGLIKANIPTRLAFAVASQMDSRTILDTSGAEKLLGRGDMLYTSPELSKPKRLQGGHVSDEEITRVVGFLKQQGAPDYDRSITEAGRSGTVFGRTDDEEEPLLDEAVQAIIQAGRASTSLLQRRLKVGYARAARIIDLLEEKGVVGPGEGAKPREVLVMEWPVGGAINEGMPTAQSDLDEAAETGQNENAAL